MRMEGSRTQARGNKSLVDVPVWGSSVFPWEDDDTPASLSVTEKSEIKHRLEPCVDLEPEK